MRFSLRRERQPDAPEAVVYADAQQMVRLEVAATRLSAAIAGGMRNFPKLGVVAEYAGGRATIKPARHGAEWEQVVIFRAETGEVHVQKQYCRPGSEFEPHGSILRAVADFTLEAGAPTITSTESDPGYRAATVVDAGVSAPMRANVCDGFRASFESLLAAGTNSTAALGEAAARDHFGQAA